MGRLEDHLRGGGVDPDIASSLEAINSLPFARTSGCSGRMQLHEAELR